MILVGLSKDHHDFLNLPHRNHHQQQEQEQEQEQQQKKHATTTFNRTINTHPYHLPSKKIGSCGFDENRSSAVATVASTGFTSMGLLRTMRVGDKGLWFGEAGEAGSSSTKRWGKILGLTWLHNFTGFPQ